METYVIYSDISLLSFLNIFRATHINLIFIKKLVKEIVAGEFLNKRLSSILFKNTADVRKF